MNDSTKNGLLAILTGIVVASAIGYFSAKAKRENGEEPAVEPEVVEE